MTKVLADGPPRPRSRHTKLQRSLNSNDKTTHFVQLCLFLGDRGGGDDTLTSLYSKWKNPVFVRPPTVKFCDAFPVFEIFNFLIGNIFTLKVLYFKKMLFLYFCISLVRHCFFAVHLIINAFNLQYLN